MHNLLFVVVYIIVGLIILNYIKSYSK